MVGWDANRLLWMCSRPWMAMTLLGCKLKVFWSYLLYLVALIHIISARWWLSTDKILRLWPCHDLKPSISLTLTLTYHAAGCQFLLFPITMHFQHFFASCSVVHSVFPMLIYNCILTRLIPLGQTFHSQTWQNSSVGCNSSLLHGAPHLVGVTALSWDTPL